ncbi:MAG: EF-hand domain-containing protein [Blastocatellales bacterium]
MKRFSIFAVCLFALLLWTSAIAQSPQGPRGARQRGGHQGGKKMKRMDTNNDGAISRDEWKGKPRVFDKIDKNNDGSLSRGESTIAGHNRGGRHLKQMDTNNDRQISRDEWKGGDEAFSQLDANNDGVISREELKARRHEGPNPPGI